MDDFFVLQKMWEDSRGDFLNEIKNTNLQAILDYLIPLKMSKFVEFCSLEKRKEGILFVHSCLAKIELQELVELLPIDALVYTDELENESKGEYFLWISISTRMLLFVERKEKTYFVFFTTNLTLANHILARKGEISYDEIQLLTLRYRLQF